MSFKHIMIFRNGNCQSYGAPYPVEKFVYENIFKDSLNIMLKSKKYQYSIGYVNQYMAINFVSCKFFGFCEGFNAAEAPLDSRHKFENYIHKCLTSKKIIEENIKRPLRKESINLNRLSTPE